MRSKARHGRQDFAGSRVAVHRRRWSNPAAGRDRRSIRGSRQSGFHLSQQAGNAPRSIVTASSPAAMSVMSTLTVMCSSATASGHGDFRRRQYLSGRNRAVLRLSGVHDCVFGIPDEEFGEALMAVVEPQPGAQSSMLRPSESISRWHWRLQGPKHIDIQKTFRGRIRQDLQAAVARSVLGAGWTKDCAFWAEVLPLLTGVGDGDAAGLWNEMRMR